MKKSLLSLLLISIPITGGCTQPRGTYQHATVQWVGGTACFSVADTSESRRTPPTITAVTVSRFTGQDWVRQWQWVTPLTPPAILSPSDCIPYGYQPPSGAGLPDSFPVLRPGERYGVEIGGHVPNPSTRGDPTVSRSYDRQFCLEEPGAETMEVVLVPRIRGALDWSICPAVEAGTDESSE